MKKRLIVINLSLFLIILILLFVPLPIPVENMDGAKNPDRFIYGGIYYTSVLEQISFGNYIPLSLLSIPIIFKFVLIKKRNKKK